MLEEKNTQLFTEESVGRIMSTNVPICHLDTTYEEALQIVLQNTWDTVHSLYVVDKNRKLLGIIDLSTTKNTSKASLARDIMQPINATLSPHDDQEKAVFYAIRDDIIAVPVIDDGTLVGVVTAHAIIDIMHQEHIEDALLAVGVRREAGDMLRRVSDGIGLSVWSRAPWLIIGTIAGLGLSLLTSQFEESLQNSIAIAYFIPVVAYVAGSIGAQSSAIAVRSLALVKLNYTAYLGREFLTGICLGVIVGALGFVGAYIISTSLPVAIAVTLALFLTSILATVLAALIPIGLKLIKKDPAVGSGPIATAALDIISIFLYFVIATTIIV